jgi:hypothetical protein
MRSLFHWDQRNYPNQRNLSHLPCLPHETLLLFHWGNVSVRGLSCSESVRDLSRSESVRDEMRHALWSAETTSWGAISLGPEKALQF